MSIRVLIAEDHSGLRDIMHLSLGLYGRFNFTEVSNGLAAVKTAMTQTFDVILMDIRMPKMDGIEATRRIREFSDTPIIVVSAYIDDETRRAAKAAGANLFISKPPDHQQLAARMMFLAERQYQAIETESITRQLISLKRHLAHLKDLRARQRGSTPVDVLMEIEDIEVEIEQIETELEADDLGDT